MAKPTTANWIMLLILGLIWGCAFAAAKLALVDFGPKTVTAGRLLVGSIALIIVMFATGRRFPRLSDPNGGRIWLHILGMGIFTNALPFNLLNWGQLYVTSSFAGVTMAAVPLLVLPLAHFLIADERLTPRKVIGFIIGFIGVVILIGPQGLLASSGSNLEPIARMACVGAAFSYAIGAMITRLCPPTALVSFSAAGLLVGTLIAVPMALYSEGLPSQASASAWAGLLYLGLMATALATVMLVTVIKSAGPSFLSLVNYQVPLWSIVVGTVLFAEALPASFIAAVGFILAGLAISQWRRRAA